MARKEPMHPLDLIVRRCSIGNVNHIDRNNGPNFHLKEMRLYEDVCKSYLTGELIIEVMQNGFERLGIAPLAVVDIDLVSEDATFRQKRYRQQYKVLSYTSRPIKPQSGGADARLELNLKLIGQEYYNDRHNTVIMGRSNKPGTTIIKEIHDKYVKHDTNRMNLRVSDGLLGTKKIPYQVQNKKPVKAIFDILDQIIYHSEPTAAPMYFRDASQFVISPLKTLLETASIVGPRFEQHPNQGKYPYAGTMHGHNWILDLKPLAPPGPTNAEAGMHPNQISTVGYIDRATGKMKETQRSTMTSEKKHDGTDAKSNIARMEAQANKTVLGGRYIFHQIDSNQTKLSTNKVASGHMQKQEAFLGALTYSPKFWISVPINTGLDVTCGKRIRVKYPFVENRRTSSTTKTLFVPRLIHEIKYTEGDNRKTTYAHGTTDLYGVLW